MAKKENYTLGSYEHNFHQFSFSSYDDNTDDWKPGVEIKGNKIPAKIEGDEITMVINEPNINDRPWYKKQTEMLMGFYKPMIKPLAKKYGLRQLHISIEPNQYGVVMLAFTTTLNQQEQLKSLIANLFIDATEMLEQMGSDYENFMFAHHRLNGEWDQLGDFETADEYVSVMRDATETAGYTWDDQDDEEYTGYWNEANKQKEEA
tara:strand:- start:11753 stop:12367 length:615 start_codon:yes stop_codon:yes gene_type:complete